MAEEAIEDTDVADTSEESVDTSTNEDTEDTDVSLEEMGVTDEDSEEEAEDSEDEIQDTEPAKEEESADDVEDVQEEQEDVSDEQNQEQGDQKRRNDEYARQRIAKKETAKQEEQQRYIQDAEDSNDLALRQLQVDAYNNKVNFNAQTLTNSLDKAVANIDLFTTGTPEQKEFMLEAADEFEANYVVKDLNGDPIEIKGDLNKYLQTKADSARRLAGVGARQQAKDKQNAKTRTMRPPSKTPKEPKIDADLAAFDEEVRKYS